MMDRSPGKSRSVPRGRGGFTLVELLVVVAIVALLVSLLLPALGGAKRQSRIAYCGANLKQLAQISFNYAVENKDRFAPVKTWGFYFYAGEIHRNIGTYYKTGYAKDPLVMFCPDASGLMTPEADVQHFGFNLEVHKPLLPDLFKPSGSYPAPYNSGNKLYYYRANSYQVRSITATYTGTNFSPINWNHPGSVTSPPPVSYPAATNYDDCNLQLLSTTLTSRHALITDLWSFAVYYQTRGHNGIINRAFGDGSVANRNYSNTPLLATNPYMGDTNWQAYMDR